MEKDTPLGFGEIVQLVPGQCGNPMFTGCMMVVTEPKPFGAQGYVQGLGADGRPAGQAYYRAKWDEMAKTGGYAEWVVGGKPEDPPACAPLVLVSP